MAFTVLCGGISHETNVFSSKRTDLSDFQARWLHRGAEIPVRMTGTNTEPAGFLDAAKAHGWQMRWSLAAAADPDGLVTATTFTALKDEILAAARLTPRPDGVLLFLHGAMVAEGAMDAEGELLLALRQLLGPDIAIIATLDLHANVTDSMAEMASALISYRTYPHIDMRERGREAGDLLELAMRQGLRLRTVAMRAPLIDGCNDGRTQAGPMVDLLTQARAFETEPGIRSVSINAGFPDSDIPEAGPSVTVSGEAPMARMREIAAGMIDEIWRRRDEKTVAILSPAEAVRQAKAVPPGPGAVTIADYADNPGAGAYGDATHLLAAMLDAGLENAAFGGLKDPDAVAAMLKAGVGAEVTLDIGGKMAPTQGGGPLHVTGIVLHLGEGRFIFEGPMLAGTGGQLGDTATMRVGGVDIFVTTRRGVQMLDLNMFRAGGIEPKTKAFLGVKSMHHFRAAFEPISRAVLVCDTGAIASPDYRTRPFRHIRRPVYPLDPPEVCEAAWRRS